MARSSWLTEGMSTNSAVSARRSVIRSSGRDAVLPEDVVELELVVLLALRQPLEDQRARQAELAAREALRPRRLHDDGAFGHIAPADLLARLAVDDRDRRREDHSGADLGAPADSRAGD